MIRACMASVLFVALALLVPATAAQASRGAIQTTEDEVIAVAKKLRSTRSAPKATEKASDEFYNVSRGSGMASVKTTTECYEPGCIVTVTAKKADEIERFQEASVASVKKWRGIQMWGPAKKAKGQYSVQLVLVGAMAQ